MKKTTFFLSIILLIITGHSFSNLKAKRIYSNVLLITIDTIRPDRLSCYSTRYLQTPNIEGLATKGALFNRAFAHNPMTLPSHANILLGTTPLYHGVHDNSKFIVVEDFLTLPEYLKSKGYSTGAFIGAFPLDSRFGLNQGFDIYDDLYPSKSSREFAYAEREAKLVIQKALNWLKEQNSEWFCWIHLWDPHAPYLPPEPFEAKFKDDLYSGEVAYVDSELGKLFNYLEDHNLMENTAIILTGDHGEALGEHGELTHGYFAYNSTLWVPLIIVGPEINASQIDEYVCHVDIFPTICDILGIKKPNFLQGVSILPLIQGRTIKKRAIYFESLNAYYNRGWAPLRGFIEGGKKFIDLPLPEFYDLEIDFKEERNFSQKIELEKYKIRLKSMEKAFSPFKHVQRFQKLDRKSREKLRSLGYIVSLDPHLKENYGVEYDLKTLLPFQRKFHLAMSLNDDNKEQESIKLLKEIIKERKDFDRAYINLSRIYSAQGLAEEAIKILEKGFNENPKNYAIISAYGILLVKEEILNKGIEVLQKALTILDFDPDVWNYLGIAYWRKGEYQQALEYYNKALHLDNSDAIIFNNLGTLHFSIFDESKKEKNLAQSIEYFKKAIELDPNLASAYNGLGGSYKLIGMIDSAIVLWEKALKLNPNYDFPLYNLGIAYLEKGNKTRAIKYFKIYLTQKKDSISPDELRKIEALIQKCERDRDH